MNARLILACLLGGVLGGAAVSVSPLHSAPAPEARPQRWEYKVVYVSSSQRGGEGEPADKMTELLNALAKDGWDYAGPVASRSSTSQYVAFRRSKF
jgi:hypothetical protein